MAVPYTFATATGSIPLSQLDGNFSTAITIGNTAVVLGDSISTINDASLANVSITSVATAFPNGYLANSNVVIGTTTINLGSTATSVNGLTLANVTISSGNVTITNVSVSTANVSTAVNTSGLVVTSNAVISTSTTASALRITQTGAGNALLVEDSANPDATPFVIDAVGNAVVGYTVSTSTTSGSGTITPHLQVHGTTSSTASIGDFGWSNAIPYYTFNKSGGAIGVYTAPTATTPLGSIYFNGSDGTSFFNAVSISGSSDSAISAGIVPGRLTINTTDTAGSNSERIRINSVGMGIGTTDTTYPLAVGSGGETLIFVPNSTVSNFGTQSSGLAFLTGNIETMRLSLNGNLGIGLTPTDTASLEIKAGTTAIAPIKLNSGTNLTTPVAGAVEFDGNVFYSTSDTTSGRGLIPTRQFRRLAADGAAIGPAIANFFAATSGSSLDTSTYYEVEFNLYFLKTTAGTLTFTLTFSNAPIFCDANYVGTPVGGVGTVGAPQTAALSKSTAAASALPVTGSLTTAVDHQYTIRAIFQANATTGGTLNLQITSSAGTVTPRIGSYYKITRLPAANTGAFA